MKTRVSILTILLATAATAAAIAQEAQERPAAGTDVGQQAAAPNPGEAALGEIIYDRYCAACHGRALKGDGPVAPGLIRKPIDLTLLSTKNRGAFPFDKVAAAIDGRKTTRTHGTPDMPVWGEIFTITSGTDAPDAPTAVNRITHYIWVNQAKSKPADAKK